MAAKRLRTRKSAVKKVSASRKKKFKHRTNFVTKDILFGRLERTRKRSKNLKTKLTEAEKKLKDIPPDIIGIGKGAGRIAADIDALAAEVNARTEKFKTIAEMGVKED